MTQWFFWSLQLGTPGLVWLLVDNIASIQFHLFYLFIMLSLGCFFSQSWSHLVAYSDCSNSGLTSCFKGSDNILWQIQPTTVVRGVWCSHKLRPGYLLQPWTGGFSSWTWERGAPQKFEFKLPQVGWWEFWVAEAIDVNYRGHKEKFNILYS